MFITTDYLYKGLPFAALLLILARSVILWFRRQRLARQFGCRPAPVAPTFFFGFDRLYQMLKATRDHRFLELVRGWHLQYGRTHKTYLAGRQAIMTADPKNVQAILAIKFKDFDLGNVRNKAFQPLLGQGIFASDGHIWERSRSLIRPNFVRNMIADMDVYESHVAKLIGAIPKDGSTVDLQELFFRMFRPLIMLSKTIDSATEFLFGHSVHTLDEYPAETSSFAKDFNTSQDGVSVRTRLGPFMFLYQNSDFFEATTRARHYVDQFVDKAVEHARDRKHDTKTSEQQYVFLYELANKTLDKTELRDQILNVLLAGRDTTASLLSITWFFLAKKPDIWDRLRKEVLTLDGRRPSFEELKSLTYLTWVLNETLRIYPVVPFNVRTANKDTCLPVGGGPDGTSPVFVPEGQEVLYSVYTMHRSPEIYGPDADEYRPERWENLKPGWAYIPFNGGPRICIGQQFALTEAGYTTVRLIQAFSSLESRDPNPFEESLALTLSSNNGTKVALTPIEPDCSS